MCIAGIASSTGKDFLCINLPQGKSGRRHNLVLKAYCFLGMCLSGMFLADDPSTGHAIQRLPTQIACLNLANMTFAHVTS